MKKLFILLSTSCLIACGGSSDEAKQGMEAIGAAQDIVSNAGNVADRQKELKEMKPLEEEAFFSWAPDAVMGLPKKESTERYLPFEKYRYSGYATNYKGDEKSIRLEIYDGAGSNIYSRYAGMLSTNAMIQERENYYEKTAERDGIKVYEWYDSKSNDSNLMFISDDRFVVTIKGSGYSPDEIWENIGDFNLSEL